MFDKDKPEEKVEEKKKGLLGKIKESTDDKEEQLAILSTFVRLGILIWSGGILTLAYVDLPPHFKFQNKISIPPLLRLSSQACSQPSAFRQLRRVQ